MRTSGSRTAARPSLEQGRRDGGAGRGAEPRRTREQQNRFRVDPAGDVRRRGVDEQRRLAGARAAEHAHGAAQTGLGQGVGRQHGAWCGHGGMSPRGSDKQPVAAQLAASTP